MKHWQCFILNYHRQRIIDFGELQLFDRYADDFVIKKIIYMHPLIQALRSELVAIVARIDSGDCDISDIDDMDEVVSVIRKVSHRDKPLSKYAACEYLHNQSCNIRQLCSARFNSARSSRTRIQGIILVQERPRFVS